MNNFCWSNRTWSFSHRFINYINIIERFINSIQFSITDNSGNSGNSISSFNCISSFNRRISIRISFNLFNSFNSGNSGTSGISDESCVLKISPLLDSAIPFAILVYTRINSFNLIVLRLNRSKGVTVIRREFHFSFITIVFNVKIMDIISIFLWVSPADTHSDRIKTIGEVISVQILQSHSCLKV